MILRKEDIKKYEEIFKNDSSPYAKNLANQLIQAFDAAFNKAWKEDNNQTKESFKLMISEQWMLGNIQYLKEHQAGQASWRMEAKLTTEEF